ncbi:MAG: flavin reductase family protein [Tepidisphaeraceae bacterium]
MKTDAHALPIAKALGKIPSGVFILTARHGARSGAMLASWVQQASFDPPCVSVALAKGRAIAQLIVDSRRLVLSVISDSDKSLMRHYARDVDENDPFAGVATVPTPNGVALAGAAAWMECELKHVAEFGADHDLFVAEVVAAEMLRDEKAFSHQRGSGFHY